jgi:hypothetical protein
LELDLPEIEKLVKEYDQDSKAIKDELFRICWYMRGGVSYTESMNLSYEDREIIGKIIESNLETTKESGMPFF